MDSVCDWLVDPMQLKCKCIYLQTDSPRHSINGLKNRALTSHGVAAESANYSMPAYWGLITQCDIFSVKNYDFYLSVISETSFFSQPVIIGLICCTWPYSVSVHLKLYPRHTCDWNRPGYSWVKPFDKSKRSGSRCLINIMSEKLSATARHSKQI